MCVYATVTYFGTVGMSYYAAAFLSTCRQRCQHFLYCSFMGVQGMAFSSGNCVTALPGLDYGF